VRILSFPEESVPRDLRRQVRELQDEAWPPGAGDPAPGVDAPVHDPLLCPRSMLLVDGDTVLAALDILSTSIVHAGRRCAVGGLSTVVTRRAARGRGHGRHLVAAAREAMGAAGRLDLGVFTCDRPLQAFYESAGWQHVPGAVLVGGTPDAPFASDRPGFDKVVVADHFTPHGRLTLATFHSARIELHPGVIDRLW
jgi:GNAT superfamily N-acetyltransferase